MRPGLTQNDEFHKKVTHFLEKLFLVKASVAQLEKKFPPI